MTKATPGRVWITTAEACALLGVSREMQRGEA